MRVSFFLLVAGAILGLAACDSPTPVEPPVADALAFGLAGPGFALRMLDACDAESFNLAVGPGTCVNRTGGIRFDSFIAQLSRHQTAEAWRFMPGRPQVRVGMTVPVLNVGGETHTYTEVAAFAGGIVPILNDLTGETEVAPECTNLGLEDFIPAGGRGEHTFGEAGEKKFMCCIHPWMRATAHVQ